MAIYYGKTVEEAVAEGLKELNLDKGLAEIKVLEEPSKGFLGLNAKKAKVEITKVRTDGERAIEFLDGLFDIMGVTAKCNLKEESEKITIELIAEDSSSLIGYRGEVLDALQSLASAIANTGREDYRRVVVDCEGYREKREETLISLAHKLAAKAVRTGRRVTLEPMNPYERRILHSALSDDADVKTQSEGKEPNRFVVIIPNNLKPEREGDRRRGGRDFRKGGKSRREEAPRQPRPKTSGFGTYLGNSLKQDEE